MPYDYEALLDEQFQQLVQALLLKVFPHMQCFPVGMPDGGRDATAVDAQTGDLVVFQVKFSRNPQKITDPYKWLTTAIDGERPKVERLVERGAKRYVLITNLGGSSHLDVGTIDKVQRYLDSSIEIPGSCLWREDLDRRLDDAYDIKLRYPNLLTGPDIIRKLWEDATFNESSQRRRSAVRAYLRQQYEADSTVRFKQVELLTTSIFDLFIDVPAVPMRDERPSKFHQIASDYNEVAYRIFQGRPNIIRTTEYDYAAELEAEYYHDQGRVFTRLRGDALLGAADILTDAEFLIKHPRIVLEGAPGQGKSTLSQYLAQIQRARLLGITDVLDACSTNHVQGPVLLPMKIELRDLGLWLNGLDPWTSSPGSEHRQPRTLETALAAHVGRYSGGVKFDVSDLHQLIESSPTILILDALDEVADLSDRQKVVNEVGDAIDRLHQLQNQIITVITGRPTALSSAPAFSRRRFTYLTLESIPPRLAVEYSKKWAAARHLNIRDTGELLSIIREKLDSPHMAELARNTMQLTILLSLVLSHGASLPDKRTHLYTAYLDRFLSRESEKSPDVRDHRDLLLDIHGYLGYYLHARAESEGSKRSNGRIGIDELRDVLVDYLKRDNRDVGLVDRLFSAVVTRVVALVPRVEGTFEFEVQPLREYFAARHLHETAPYSPTGRERRGTKPDRFEGVASNPYWMNVTRFFAGFFSKGELLDLAQCVCDLIAKPENVGKTYPRTLAIALLQDWVFSQSPRATEQVVRATFDKLGVRWAANRSHLGGRIMPDGRRGVVLSPGAGAEYATGIIWDEIVQAPESQWVFGLSRLVKQFESRVAVTGRWSEVFEKTPAEYRTSWVRIASHLGILGELDLLTFRKVLDLGRIEGRDRRLAACRGFETCVEKLDDHEIQAYLQSIANSCTNSGYIGVMRPRSPAIRALLFLAHPMTWVGHLRDDDLSIISRVRELADALEGDPDGYSDEFGLLQSVKRANAVLISLLSGGVVHSLEPWTQAISLVEPLLGGLSWYSLELGIAAAGIRSSTERAGGVRHLLRRDHPLPKRVRMARRFSNDATWWRRQSQDIASIDDRFLWLLCASVWTSSAVFCELLPDIESFLAEISLSDRQKIVRVVDRSRQYSPRMRDRIGGGAAAKFLGSASTPGLQLAIRRMTNEAEQLTIRRRFLGEIPDPSVIDDCVGFLLRRLTLGTEDASNELELLIECMHAGADIGRSRIPRVLDREIRRRSARLPASDIIDKCVDVPPMLLDIALDWEDFRERKPEDVLSIADREGWFETVSTD